MSTADPLRNEILALFAGAPAAVVSDALDRLGRRNQALDPSIRPLWPEARLVGFALPVVIAANTSEPAHPYAGEMTALEALRAGDVPMLAVEPGVLAASWGELFSCAAIGAGSPGVVIDGLTRDASAIRELDFPTFARGLSPLDTFARAVVKEVGVETRVGGVDVSPGDLVVGDVDGVVVVPGDLVTEVAAAVGVKRRLEGNARADLLTGMGIRAVWERYGVF